MQKPNDMIPGEGLLSYIRRKEKECNNELGKAPKLSLKDFKNREPQPWIILTNREGLEYWNKFFDNIVKEKGLIIKDPYKADVDLTQFLTKNNSKDNKQYKWNIEDETKGK